MKSLIPLLGVFFCLGIASQSMAIETDFYIVAHADDWQLFMGDKAMADVQANHRVIFIQLGSASDGSWLRWEEGNQVSIESMAGGDGSTINAACSWHTIHGHLICKRSYKNTASYYLRLPVAHHETGHGFEVTKFQTLEQTHLGLNVLESVGENATRYESFSELVSTLDTIISMELDGSDTAALTINAQDPDPEINLNDHIDHLTAGCAASLTARKASARLHLYVDYHSMNWPQNLDPESVAVKTRLFSLFDSKVGIGMNPYFEAFIRRTIFRNVPMAPTTDELLFYNSRLGTGKYKSLLSGCEKHYRNWRTSWQMLVSGKFSGREESEVFLYDPWAGEANLVSVRDRYVQVTYKGLRKDWTSITTMRRHDKDYLLFYSRDTGDTEVWSLSNDQMEFIQAFPGWRRTWKIILAGNFTREEEDSQETHELFLYDDINGESEIWRTSGKSISLVDSYNGWRKFWSAAVAGDFAGNSNDDIFFFDHSTGEANLLISQPGHPFMQHTYSGWSKSSRLLTTARYGGSKVNILIHDPVTSELEIWDFNNDRQLVGQQTLRDDWDRVLSGMFGGLPE